MAEMIGEDMEAGWGYKARLRVETRAAEDHTRALGGMILSIVTLVATRGRQPEGGRHVHAGREAANGDDN
ncbi:hypothetical protein GOD47_11700 [Sinorhizobium medicae]|nr:hypothetical protein [Sinorhizobium medicae]MDX0725706.1 hypothetical protein [Sinorhizobium medicae]MDX0732065.1 hypothetical protein [Sinorhizobium medicae]